MFKRIWECEYEGHTIKAVNNWVQEKLYIDGGLVDECQGLFRFSAKLYGKLTLGPDKTVEIKVLMGQSWKGVTCKIWADSLLIYPAPEPVA